MNRQTLIAVIDRIIPADEFPSASQAGVQHYLAGICANEQKHAAVAIEMLVAELAAKNFMQLSFAEQDALLAEYQTASPFLALVELVMEGYYADPSNGGNLDAASWRMIGYRP